LVVILMICSLNIYLGSNLSYILKKTARILIDKTSRYDRRPHRSSGGTVFHTYIGRTGNQLFQLAAVTNISAQNGMGVCIRGGDIHEIFDGVAAECQKPFPWYSVREKGYALWEKFELYHKDTILYGFLQSYKYIDPGIRKKIQFKPIILSHAKVVLSNFPEFFLIGIHIRQYEQVHLRAPTRQYYVNAMSYFISRYQSVGFVVVCEDPVWCTKQPQFQRENTHIMEKNHFAIDMAILASCDHMIISMGTFGWWAAYIGPDSRGGMVVYFQNEFVQHHMNNYGFVKLEDYYPPTWLPMTDQS
jgi:galactoside 2-L-fucosyltransferase 1/2